MKVNAQNFIPAAQIAINNPDLQAAVIKGTSSAYWNRIKAMTAYGFEHGEALRQQAAEAKRRTLRYLPENLEKAEAVMKANGIQVLWAMDGAEANQHVLEIARRHQVQKVVKSKSMVTEETALNPLLEEHGIRVVETDLGEFIVQIDHDHPSHIIAPIIHKTKNSIRDAFVRELNMPFTDDTSVMASFARQYLRQEFLSADMGVSGGNFIIAETGSLCLVTNEGNGRLVTTLPRVHVALVGIEKVVETLQDYAALTQILPRSGTGQSMAVYTQMINGPRREGDTDGPEHLYVILVDGGRSDIYASQYVEALACIRCGACQNACPVYQATGGHAYGWVYGGPIGAVITPLLVGTENASLLPQASSLCGACKQVCPVDIDIPRMLLELRHELVQDGETEAKWTFALRLWAWANRSARLFAWGGKLSRWGQRRFKWWRSAGPLKEWTKYREFPNFAPQSFREQWQARQKQKGKTP